MKEIADYSEYAKEQDENTIAAGLALFDSTKHASLIPVFEEADSAMYERKKAMKGKNGTVR